MLPKHPFFSIIVPTYNRPQKLADCLESLSHLDYPHDRFEVIVIDDGSSAPIQPVVEGFVNQLDVTLLTQTNAGPAAARNHGAKRAKGEFLAFTDDDCAPSPDWLKALAVRFGETPDYMVGGRTLNGLANNLYSTATHFLIEYLYSYHNAKSGQAHFLTSNNLALKGDRFHSIDGFNTFFSHAAAEDRELCDRWLRNGYRMTFAPEALVYHAHKLTFCSFCRQHFNYGSGAFSFHRGRSCSGAKNLGVEPLSFYLNLLRYPLSQNRPSQALLLLPLMVLSQVATVAGFLREMVRQMIKKDNQPLSLERHD
ncbi:MAG TPA: glycosyltransferase [Thermodesulfobacteriota bacterium]|nr:glycosyltransferase [Thermodesulfobacteriota bacterium]